jgi:O-antigen/teichoic acid export membrane protein
MSLQRSVAANFLASGWAALVGLAFIPLYIRYLGIESYGLIGFFATVQAWLFVLDMGLSPALNREMARYSAGVVPAQGIRDLLKSIEWVYAAIAVLIALALAALSPLIAGYWLKAQALATDTVAHAVLLMGLAASLQWMAILYRAALQGLQRQVWLSAVNAAVATVRAGGAVLVLAFISPTITAFLVFLCAVGLAESLVLRGHLRRHLPAPVTPPRFSGAALRTISGFASGLALTMLLGTMLTQLDKLLLARLLPLDQFGYFALAVAVAGALSVLITPINNVAYPRLSEMVAAGSEPALAQQYHRFAQLLAIGILPPTLVICLFSEGVMRVWTGDAAMALAVAPLLSVWVVGTALNGLMHVPYTAQLAHGWPRLSALLNMAAVAFMVPAVLLLVPRHGAIAAAWVWVAVNAGYIVFGIALMHRRILVAEKWSWYIRDTLVPVLACSMAAALLWLARDSAGPLTRLQETAFLGAGTLALALATALAAPLGREILASAPRYFQAWTTARKW